MAPRVVKFGNTSSATFAITIDDSRVSLALSTFGQRLTDFRRFWSDFFAPQFFDDIQKNFAASGQYVGGWRALSPRYAAWKLRHFGPLPILVRSGTMAESLRIGGRFNIFRVQRMKAQFGSSVPWLPYHQRGTRRMPRRQVLWIGPGRTYQVLLNRFLNEELRASGLGARRA